MKKSLFFSVLAAVALAFSGCRYSGETVVGPDLNAPAVTAMSLQDAQAVITKAFSDPPTGRRPKNPGWENLAATTSIDYRKHDRTGFYLLELKRNEKVSIRFYVYSKNDADRFINAVWRVKKEYTK